MVHWRADEFPVQRVAHPDYLRELEEAISGRKRAGRSISLYDATVVQVHANPLASWTPAWVASKPTNIVLLVKVSDR